MNIRSCGAAVARRRCEVARRLIAPRPVVRVLHHRHQLHVGEAGPLEVVGELHGDGAVATGFVTPGTEVHLVGRDRGVVAVTCRPLRHPLTVAPLVVEVGDHRRRAWWLLGGEGERVALVEHRTAGGDDAVLVAAPDAGRRDAPGPDAGRRRRERAAIARPAVEVTDHRDRAGGRCPHPKDRAVRIGMRAEQVGETVVRAFAEPPQVVGGESRC